MDEQHSSEGAICPYCSSLMRPDNDHYSLFSEETSEYECSSCGKEFHVNVIVSRTWVTSPIEGAE